MHSALRAAGRPRVKPQVRRQQQEAAQAVTRSTGGAPVIPPAILPAVPPAVPPAIPPGIIGQPVVPDAEGGCGRGVPWRATGCCTALKSVRCALTCKACRSIPCLCVWPHVYTHTEKKLRNRPLPLYRLARSSHVWRVWWKNDCRVPHEPVDPMQPYTGGLPGTLFIAPSSHASGGLGRRRLFRLALAPASFASCRRWQPA